MFLQNVYLDTLLGDFELIVCESCRFGDPFKIQWALRRIQKGQGFFLDGPRSSWRKVHTDAWTQDMFSSRFRCDFEDFSNCFWKQLLLLFALLRFMFRTQCWCNVQLFSCLVEASLGRLCMFFLLGLCMKIPVIFTAENSSNISADHTSTIYRRKYQYYFPPKIPVYIHLLKNNSYENCSNFWTIFKQS